MEIEPETGRSSEAVPETVTEEVLEEVPEEVPEAVPQVPPCAICTIAKGSCSVNCVFSTMRAADYGIIRRTIGRGSFKQLTNRAKSDDDRAEISRTLIGESRMRVEDPIKGCYGAFEISNQKVNVLEENITILEKKVAELLEEIQTINNLICLKSQGEPQFVNAMELAIQKLPSVHPVRLGLALDIASHHFGQGARAKACDIADEAILSAESDIDSVFAGIEVPRDTNTLMGLLKEKFEAWRL